MTRSGLFRALPPDLRQITAGILAGLVLGMILPGTVSAAKNSTPRVSTPKKPTAFVDHRPRLDTVPKGKWLDMHVHVAGIGTGGSGCFVHQKIKESFKFGIYLHAFDVSEHELRDSGDALIFDRLIKRMRNTKRIGRAIVLALDGVIRNGRVDTNLTQIYVPNDWVRRETRKRPELLYAASINPARPFAIQLLRQAALDGAVFLKWIPSIMHIDPSDTGLVAFYLEMKRLHLPLVTHTGTEKAFLESHDEYNDPRLLRLPLELGVTVIAAHAAVPGHADGQSYSEMLRGMMREYPNLYADISSLTQINKLRSLKPLLADSVARSRLIYGSDYPLSFTRLVSPVYHTHAIGIGKVKQLRAMPEHWDRDVALKEALGVPPEVFYRTATLLLPNLPPISKPAHSSARPKQKPRKASTPKSNR
jgi:uncharacterized protein